MISQFGNAMISMMLVKFMFNDVPHSTGLISSGPSWLPESSRRLSASYPKLAEGIEGSTVDLRVIICGYNDIANQEASTSEINDVARVLAKSGRTLELQITEAGLSWSYYLENAEISISDWNGTINTLKYGDREGKVIAIDAYMHYSHYSGLFFMEALPGVGDAMANEEPAISILRWMTELAGEEWEEDLDVEEELAKRDDK